MNIYYTTQFKKDYKKLKRQNKNINKLKMVIEKLIAEEALEINYKDHQLSGNWQGFKDCHIEPDWILIYKISVDTLFLERTVSHSELFRT